MCRFFEGCCFTLTCTSVIFIISGLYLASKPVINKTTGEPMYDCPGTRFVYGGSTAFISNPNPPSQYRTCFTLPERVMAPNRYCTKAPSDKCTPNFFIPRCYSPGVCPPGYTWQSTTLNTISTKTGPKVHTQAVCCR